MNLKAEPNCCEEASAMSTDFYIPCNKPATQRVWVERDQCEYRMCDPCAHHTIKNRGDNNSIKGAYQGGD